jgi:hypothetical protein
VSICSDGVNAYVAWTEYTTDNWLKTQTPSQVYVCKWNGSAWVAVGGSVNVSTSAAADDAFIIYWSGQPYVAWTEATTGGNAKLFVKTFNGSSWSLAGTGALNRDTTTGWAFRPSMATDAGGSLYLGWTEQQALGQRTQAHVATYNGGTWTALGGSLNADPVAGSAQRISLAVAGGQPVAAWGEVNFGSLRQVFAKQWNGTNWTLLSGTVAGPSPAPSPSPTPACDLDSDGKVNIVDVQIAINQARGAIPCTTADVKQDGQCNATDVQRVVNASLGGACVVGP